MFHKHKWEEVARRYSPGSDRLKGKGMTIEEAERTVHGFTAIEMRCEGCGDLKFKKVTGDQTNADSGNKR